MNARRLNHLDRTLAGYSADAQDASAFALAGPCCPLQADAAPADNERYAKARALARPAQGRSRRSRAARTRTRTPRRASSGWRIRALGPFLAELATANNDAAGYADAVRYLRRSSTTSEMRSQSFSLRASTAGLYAAAVVDTLERLPAKHPGRVHVRNILVRLANAVASVQDVQSVVFCPVLDAPKRGKNYLEASLSWAPSAPRP